HITNLQMVVIASRRRTNGFSIALLLTLVAGSLPLCAQSSKTADSDPREMLRQAVDNEIAYWNNPAKFMFRSRKQTQKGVQNRIYAEANEAVASMLTGAGDQPLTPEQERAEADRLKQVASHPDQLKKQQAHEAQQRGQIIRLLKALPDAF